MVYLRMQLCSLTSDIGQFLSNVKRKCAHVRSIFDFIYLISEILILPFWAISNDRFQCLVAQMTDILEKCHSFWPLDTLIWHSLILYCALLACTNNECWFVWTSQQCIRYDSKSTIALLLPLQSSITTTTSISSSRASLLLPRSSYNHDNAIQASQATHASAGSGSNVVVTSASVALPSHPCSRKLFFPFTLKNQPCFIKQ